jgi:hypothetical protein
MDNSDKERLVEAIAWVVIIIMLWLYQYIKHLIYG